MMRVLHATVLLLVLIQRPAFAHGGEDHGETPAPAQHSATPSVSATGDAFELLLRYRRDGTDSPVTVEAFLADAPTNVPVAGADIDVTLSSSAGEWHVKPSPTETPGIYRGSVAVPSDGDYDVVASITAGEASDLLTLGTMHVGAASASAPPSPKASSGVRPLVIGVLVVAAVLVVVLGVLRRRRRVEASRA
jgi:hypothetical protein